MISYSNPAAASTPASSRAAAETRDGGGSSGGRGRAEVPCPGEGKAFTVGGGVERGANRPYYERKPDDPLYRPLFIYSVDAGARQDEGAMAVVNVPFEPLKKDHKGGKPLKNGIKGDIFHVMPVFENPAREEDDDEIDIDLNDPSLLLTRGRAPSPVDPAFHQQMVYAVASVVYASFRRALGRHVPWGFKPHRGDQGRARLQLFPHGSRGHAGACYDRSGGAIHFGFVKTESEVRGRAVPHGHTFSCVSHDVVTHEVTHALLDGLRKYFLEPTSADVLGFHEGFADIVALLHHFSYKEVLRGAMRRHHGQVLKSALITSIAIEFGRAIGNGGPVRSFHQSLARARAARARAAGDQPPAGAPQDPDLADEEPVVVTYRPDMGPHEMGEVFVSAVLHAFATVYTRKAERFLRLATGGTGVLPPGDISPDLQDLLAEEASQLASQFLNVCIRAIDYCPPVDLQLGDFLRAVITADLDLVPDDAWGYREAWIDAFAQHHIYPRDVQSMSEDALKWESAPDGLQVEELSLSRLEFDGDPGCAASGSELRRRACALGTFVVQHPEKFGMLRAGHARLAGDTVTLPEVQSVRTSRRVGPDGQVVFDLVAEVTQTRKVDGEFKFLFRGGCTVILGPRGEVRYVIGKSVGQNSRVFRQRKFMQSAGAEYVSQAEDGWNVPDAETVQFAHQHGRRPPADATGTANGQAPTNGQTQH